MISLQNSPIDPQLITDHAFANGAGAVNVFIGTIRGNSEGKKVVQLEYEAHEPMAVSETRKILAQADEKWTILGSAVCHRLGIVKPGEIAVVVAVSTKHRKESFEACEFIIDNLKKTVPIFKKEVFEDGSVWVGALKA